MSKNEMITKIETIRELEELIEEAKAEAPRPSDDGQITEVSDFDL